MGWHGVLALDPLGNARSNIFKKSSARSTLGYLEFYLAIEAVLGASRAHIGSQMINTILLLDDVELS